MGTNSLISTLDDSKILIRLFNQCFMASHNTQLVGGAREPEYRPADHLCHHHRIIFTKDYVASALHEIAHWCIAGDERRQQLDYGYWYLPDGRNSQQQVDFETVEVKPQALEWVFSMACGLGFRVSADNLDGDNTGPSLRFKQAVVQQAQDYCRQGLKTRAGRWLSVLQSYTDVNDVLCPQLYRLESLSSF